MILPLFLCFLWLRCGRTYPKVPFINLLLIHRSRPHQNCCYIRFGHMVHRNNTAFPHSLTCSLQSNRLDLNRYALGQLVDGDACPGRLVREPLLIFAVHLREVGHVCDEDLWRWWHQCKVEKGNWPGRQQVTTEARGQDWSCSCKHPRAAL